MENITGYIFDLDGVIVDTARYHFLAWGLMAKGLGIVLTKDDNEKLKGVSRMSALDIILEIGDLSLDMEEKERLAKKKNLCYVEYIQNLKRSEILPGVEEYLERVKSIGCRIALGSASKNAPLILKRLALRDYFDAVVDGNSVSKAKPDPEVFLAAARAIDTPPENCVVFEDAAAGIEAALAAGMTAVGVGMEENLPGAKMWVKGLFEAPLRF